MPNIVVDDVEGVVLSASTVDLGAEDKIRLNIIGDTNISSFGTEPNYFRILRLYGTPTITHNGTTMNMPGATNYTPTAGQIVYVSSDGDGNAYLVEDLDTVAVDSTTVDAAGAVMNSDTSTAAMSFVVDEDNMTSDSATKVPTQQSVKAYVDASASPDWTYATPQATTSGTAFDFTGIPSGTSEIEVFIDGVSIDGNEDLLIQIGDAGGVETTGYNSATFETGTTTESTAGFIVYLKVASRNSYTVMRLMRASSDGTDWFSMHGGYATSPVGHAGGGRKTLTAELTQVRLTRSGSANFDAGQISLRYK